MRTVDGQLFLISVLLLFLELACIRWFSAHVIFLTFFTNTVLLACFLGMSLGCLAARWSRNFLPWTPILLAIAVTAARGIGSPRLGLARAIDVGDQASPQVVYFGTEYYVHDLARFAIPVEVLCGFFFLILALAFVGLGQELGRALNRLPNRVHAYTLNILGSIAGIVLFAACAWLELSPFWWFLLAIPGLAYFLAFGPLIHQPVVRWAAFVSLAAIPVLGSFTTATAQWSGEATHESFWSPYYRIDYEYTDRTIAVNKIGHQSMVPRTESFSPAYALPHLLNRDVGGRPFEEVLIIGAGSGNDVSRALQWGAKRIDAVEIDPVILRLGQQYHPDHPYQDPRVTAHLDDGRNFLRSNNRQYDLIVYALVDSLVLHSSYSNIRLESYLFTRQAFEDVRRSLKPGGLFVMYNFFRQGWIVARLDRMLQTIFETEPLALTLPYRPIVDMDTTGGFTVFMVGNTGPFQRAFRQRPLYWLRDTEPPGPHTPNGFEHSPDGRPADGWEWFGLANVVPSVNLRIATDNWPFLYMREPTIPMVNLRGMIIMGALALALLVVFLPKRQGHGRRFAFSGPMFFLGAGFMLVETKAVVHMALLFGSTWLVNSIVFFAVLIMILAANLFVLKVQPLRLWPYYAGLLAALAVNFLVPLDFFLGMTRTLQVAGSCLVVFTPILFAGVVFATLFSRSKEPDRDFGANIAGAMGGGLAEYSSMLLGFQYLMLVASVFYALSAMLPKNSPADRATPLSAPVHG
jgi:SAM-dependent methyltransferase